MRSEGYGSRRVCVCVCLSVKSHLTSGASVRPEKAVTHSAGNESQTFCGLFPETALFQSYAGPAEAIKGWSGPPRARNAPTRGV